MSNHATAPIARPTASGPQAPASQRTLADLPAPRGLPWLGNLLQLAPQRLHLVLEAWADRLGPFYTVRLGPKRVLIVSDLASMQRIMRDRPDDYRRLSPIEPVFKELNGHGVFSAEGPSWKRQRKLVMPAFSMKQQRELYPGIAMFTERLRAYLAAAAGRGEVLDIRKDVMRYTVDVTSHMVFGHDLDTISDPRSELQAHLHRIFNCINSRVGALFPYWRYLKLPRDRAVDRSLSAVHAMLSERIAEARSALRDPARFAAPKTLLEAMLVAQHDDDPATRLSDESVVGNALTLLLAGEDTTSNTMAWIFHYLAHEPTVQARAREEVDRVLGSSGVLSKYEDAAKLRYITAIVHETLRMRSAAPLLFLETTRALTLGELALPAGTPIFLLTRHAGVAEANFTRGDSFQPERWLDNASSNAAAALMRHDPHAALAFGAGPRTCPGRSLALFECLMVISMALRNFGIQAVDARDAVQERYDFTMHPIGLRVRLVAR